MRGREGIEDGSVGNKKGGKGRGPQKFVNTPISKILKNTLIADLM